MGGSPRGRPTRSGPLLSGCAHANRRAACHGRAASADPIDPVLPPPRVRSCRFSPRPRPAPTGGDPGMRRAALGLLSVALLGAAAGVTAAPPTPTESARAMLKSYQQGPARIDRARDLLETAVAQGAGNDVPTLLALTRAWFLYAEQRAKSEPETIAAYERARDVAKRATELAPKDPEAHLWYAITLGSWSQAKGLLHSAIALRNLRKEVEVVIQLDPNNIEAHVMAGSIDRELPVLLGGDRRAYEAHFKTAQRLGPRLNGRGA